MINLAFYKKSGEIKENIGRTYKLLFHSEEIMGLIETVFELF